jgi:hypothetical protein
MIHENLMSVYYNGIVHHHLLTISFIILSAECACQLCAVYFQTCCFIYATISVRTNRSLRYSNLHVKIFGEDTGPWGSENEALMNSWLLPLLLQHSNDLTVLCSLYVCMYKGWAIKLTHVPRPLMIYCPSPFAAAMIITVAALRIVLAHGSKPT